MRWRTVAICEDCWTSEHPSRVPVRALLPDGADVERCYACGSPTAAAIYVRREVRS